MLTPKRFEELFNEQYERLCRSSYRIVLNEQTAEDIVQDVFCTLWKKREYLQLDSPEGYLLRSVYNASLNFLKKDKASALKTLKEENLEIADYHHVPSHKVEFLETQSKLKEVIEGLPIACRAIFVLSRFENKTNKEIATELNLSVKTVENQMTKALKILRKSFLAILLNL